MAVNFKKKPEKIFIFFVFAMLTIESPAQLADAVNYSNYSTAISLKDQPNIAGIQLSCIHKVLYVALDSTTNLLTIKTKYSDDKVTLMVYDLVQKKLLWSMQVNPRKYNVISLQKYILLTNEEKTQCFNKYTGVELWNSNREVLYVNEKNDVAFTYFTHFDASHPDKLLEAISLNDGKKIWKREIDRHYGWNEIQNMNDSTIILSASGLHPIHLKTGKGWDFDAQTGELFKDDSEQLRKAAFVATTIAFGIFAGISVYYFTHTNELLWELCSNLIIEDGKIYYASKRTLSALDLKGKLLWQTKLVDEITGNSKLKIEDSLIIMVNKGYAAKGQSTIFYGTPYIATFNKSIGTQNFIKKINLEENAISDFKIKDEVIYLIQKGRMSSYSLKDGEFLNRMNMPAFIESRACQFKSKLDFKIREGASMPSNNASDSLLYVFSPQLGLLIYSTNFNELGRIQSENLFLKSHQYKDYQFFCTKDELMVVDSKGNTIADLKMPGLSNFKSNWLYCVKDNAIYLFDLGQIKQ